MHARDNTQNTPYTPAVANSVWDALSFISSVGIPKSVSSLSNHSPTYLYNNPEAVNFDRDALVVILDEQRDDAQERNAEDGCQQAERST